MTIMSTFDLRTLDLLLPASSNQTYTVEWPNLATGMTPGKSNKKQRLHGNKTVIVIAIALFPKTKRPSKVIAIQVTYSNF